MAKSAKRRPQGASSPRVGSSKNTAPQNTAPTGSDPESSAEPGAPRDWKAAWPFLAAVVVIVLAVGGLGISYLMRPPEERVSEDAKVQWAINGQYTARNGPDYASYREHTCAKDLADPEFVTEAAFVADNQRSLDTNGPIQIPEITDLVVTGDRATADVHWHFKNSSDNTQIVPTIVVREDGDWKVCTS
ncbi:hypothetical protein QSJ18_17690 [Gordonia sp. ABSL1-1]|uniref:Rv0361 family membrane protein n=1 Tax=Gordonia sp. ABSL1-1 TaxID=3053923 RepID=UPI002573A4EF|nr:hypothetical protein [Gordonia sp. ABSL1-1]MDL9938582.1 hypothetical protein [Gordonia sp. ABSL1-1]